jgi:hypothetical protein
LREQCLLCDQVRPGDRARIELALQQPLLVALNLDDAFGRRDLRSQGGWITVDVTLVVSVTYAACSWKR